MKGLRKAGRETSNSSRKARPARSMAGKRQLPPAALSRRRAKERYTMITGGAGFIGTNLASRLLSSGRSVLLYDNLSRPGVEQNLRWLRRVYGELVRIEIAVISCKKPKDAK